MPNEEDVKNLLTGWLKTFKVNVYWEKKNKWSHPKFKCSTSDKPDLLIENTGGVYWAVEVKNAIVGSKGVHNAMVQIKRYADIGAKYYIEDCDFTIIPKGYLIATQNSINGHLFDDEEIEQATEGRTWAIKTGQLPQKEYKDTKNAIRLLWKLAKEDGIEYPIGGLLSNILNSDSSIAPLLLYNKGKHGQMFEVWI